MLETIRYNNSPRKIVHQGCSFLFVNHPVQLEKYDLMLVDAFVLDIDSDSVSREIIKQIRKNTNIRIALKPIFNNLINVLSVDNMTHTDGELETSVLSSYIQRIVTINKRILMIETPKYFSDEKLVQFKTIAFLYTRNKILKPRISRNSNIGYEFPFISLFYKQSNSMLLLKDLQSSKDSGYLSFKFLDYVHLCKSCHGNYLNFRECCPKCNSIDIRVHDVIHHFTCAYVGPEEDFKKGDSLECPKCNKALRHIGVDYDKPSIMYFCNSCSNEFQNPDMLAMCIDCGTENHIEELSQKAIGEYSITESGEHYLFSNKKTLVLKRQQESKDTDGLTINIFKILLEQEIKRVKDTNCNSFFASLSFKAEELQLLNSDSKKALMLEIEGIIKSYLKESDAISADEFNSYYLLMPDTKESQLDRLQNIHYNLTKLLSDNLKNKPKKIDISLKEIESTDVLQNYFS